MKKHAAGSSTNPLRTVLLCQLGIDSHGESKLVLHCKMKMHKLGAEEVFKMSCVIAISCVHRGAVCQASLIKF